MPPRKRGLSSVPPPEPGTPIGKGEYITQPNGQGKGAASSVEKWKANGRPVGHNRARILANQEYNSGPDMPPGKAISWLPSPKEVPPKPKAEPTMEYPGVGFMVAGHGEWQLWTNLAPNAKELEADGKPWILGREWRKRWVPPDERRCVARSTGKFSEWMGNRCTMRAIKGGRVCTAHGGRLGTVRKAAQKALAIAALPAAEKLIHIALNKRGVSDADRIKAIVQILDRAGVEGRQTIEIEIAPWQKALERVYSEAPDGSAIDAEEVEGVDYEVDDDDDEVEAGDGEEE